MKMAILHRQWWTVPDGPTIFIGIGAAKAGSTWLANYLWRHDEVFLSPTKGVRYFDRKHGGFGRNFKEIPRSDLSVRSHLQNCIMNAVVVYVPLGY